MRFFPELVEMPEGLDEGVLHGLFGVLDVPEDSECHAKDAALMPPNEKLKGPSVASQNAFHQNKVAFRTFTLRDLGWFDHIGELRYFFRTIGLPYRGERFKAPAASLRSTLIDCPLR